eukprot:scaffold84988_cov18-Tisochrysis_lutea.AAC.1
MRPCSSPQPLAEVAAPQEEGADAAQVNGEVIPELMDLMPTGMKYSQAAHSPTARLKECCGQAWSFHPPAEVADEEGADAAEVIGDSGGRMMFKGAELVVGWPGALQQNMCV